MLAARRGFEEVVEFLVRCGADIKRKTKVFGPVLLSLSQF